MGIWSKLASAMTLLSFIFASRGISHAQEKNNPERWSAARERMVREQIVARGVQDATVLKALRQVPRHLFVPEGLQSEAYDDNPLPIGHGQTISQPYIVAFMTGQLNLSSSDKVLEIGTGSGYQAAILAEICKEVYTIEIVDPLARESKKLLKSLGYKNVHVRSGDGYRGWPEAAPFDAVIVTAAPDKVPRPLIEQLKVGGRMIIPVGSWFQNLRLITKTSDGLREKNVMPVRFVPMTGEAENH